MFGKRNLQRGFTLVEVIVMATVTTVGLLAILIVADRTLQTSDTNENRVAAVNLSREGIELVRAARDSNWQAKSNQEALGTVPANQIQDWDCYANQSGSAQSVILGTLKPACDDRWSVSDAVRQFRAIPFVQNGVPYFELVGNGTTKDGDYRVCQAQGDTPIFTANPTANDSEACPQGVTFYRRISVERGKTLNAGLGQYSLLVKSYVTWLGNNGPEVSMQEYLTDWKK